MKALYSVEWDNDGRDCIQIRLLELHKPGTQERLGMDGWMGRGWGFCEEATVHWTNIITAKAQRVA